MARNICDNILPHDLQISGATNHLFEIGLYIRRIISKPRFVLIYLLFYSLQNIILLLIPDNSDLWLIFGDWSRLLKKWSLH